MSSDQRKSQQTQPKRKGLVIGIQPLPPSFAEQVIELEMLLDTNKSLAVLKTLLALYTVIFKQEAISYYASTHDPKAQFYQHRMQNLVSKPEIQELMNPAPPDPKNPFDVPTTRLRSNTGQISPPKRNKLQKQREAEMAIKKHQNATKDTSQRIQSNIKDQQNTLEARIMQRQSMNGGRRSHSNQPKKKRSLKEVQLEGSITTNEIDLIIERRSREEESDRGGGMPIIQHQRTFESELEAIMEKYIMAKLEESQRIKAKYMYEIQQMQEEGTEIAQQVIQDLRRKMEDEVSAAKKEIDSQRKSEVEKMRARFVMQVGIQK